MYCKSCGTKMDDDAVFCSKCGTNKDSNENFTYCEKCGTKITEDAAFCTECGTPIPENILENRRLLQKENAKKENDKKRIIIIGTILTLIEIGIVLLFRFGLGGLISSIISIFIVVIGLKQLPKIKGYKERALTIFWVIMIVIGFIPIIRVFCYIIYIIFFY